MMVNVLRWAWHSLFLVLFIFIIWDVFQQKQPENDRRRGAGRGMLTHPDETTCVSECMFTATCSLLSLCLSPRPSPLTGSTF